MTSFNSVKSKILTVLFGSIAALCIVIAVAMSRINVDLRNFDAVVNIDQHASQLALQANVEFKRQVQEWKNILLRGSDAEQLAKYWQGFNEQHDSVQAIVQELIPILPPNSETASIAKQFLADHSAMKQAYNDGRSQFIASGFDSAVGDKVVSGIDRAPSDALDAIVELLGVQVAGKIMDLDKSSKRNFTLSVISVVVVLLLVGFIAVWLINRIIVTPLRLVASNLTLLGEGELTSACAYRNNDEIGDIANAARVVHSFLTRNVETMKATSKALSVSSSHLSEMSAELSRQSAEQFSATEQVATAIQELTHSAGEVSNNSSMTLEITKDTAKKSSDGTLIAESAKNQSTQLVNELQKNGLVIEELAENATNVGNVLDVIGAIAEQTNLLALNAAIEAARAGDQGRGFAVVADEVRTLAQRTQDSTAEIERILESVKTGADKAVIAIGEGQQSSHKTEKDITEASNALQEIATMVAEINDKNVQIATASQEQTDVATGISTLMHDIQGLAEATNSRVEQTKQISHELDSLIREFDQQIAMFKL